MSILGTIKGWFSRDITEDRDTDRDSYFVSIGDGWYAPSMTFSGVNLDELIQAATWAYAAIEGNSRTMASLEPIVQTRKGGTWAQAPESHNLWQFIQSPMGRDPAYPNWSWGRLMHLTFLHRYAAGSAFWRPAVFGDKLLGVTPLLSPGAMSATEHPSLKFVEEYHYSITGDTWRPDEVVNINVPSADSYWKGASPLRAALQPISTDNYAATRQDAALRNRVGLGPIVSVKTPLGPSRGQEDELYDRLISNYGDAKNEGLPWIVGGDIEVTEGPKASDLELFETRKYCREQILSVLGMPPPVAGVMDRATWSNFEQANISWWTHYLFPNINDTYRAINTQLIQRVYGPDVRLWYDLTGSEIAQQLFGQRVKMGLDLQKLGYSTNAINERLDLGMDSPEYLDLPNTQLVQAGRVALSDVVEMLRGGLDALVKEPEPVPVALQPVDDDGTEEPEEPAEGDQPEPAAAP